MARDVVHDVPEAWADAGAPDVEVFGSHDVADAEWAELLRRGGGWEPFEQVARLATTVLAVPVALVTIADARRSFWSDRVEPTSGASAAMEQALSRRIVASGSQVVLDDIRGDRCLALDADASAGLLAWAGFPVRDREGRVLGAFMVAAEGPRQWSAHDVGVLEALALAASGEVALRVALDEARVYARERSTLARTLQESLLPPTLTRIPGLEVAAAYVAGAGGGDVLGDFYDVFPAARGTWGLVVGDVCGKGPGAAKTTALARYTVRTEAHRTAQPTRVLAALNRALLEWITGDPRFVTAVYASVRPAGACADVRLCCAGHPPALALRADGAVEAIGGNGALLGVFADPELRDRRVRLLPGDSLVFYTDGVTEARRPGDTELYGDDRLARLVAGLGGLDAAAMADAIRTEVVTFSEGFPRDDTAVLVLRIPDGGSATGRS